MNGRLVRAAAWMLLVQALAWPAGAEIYKSVDADGNVTFSQKPPKGTAAEVVTPRYARPSNTGSAAAGSGTPPASNAAPAGANDTVPAQTATTRTEPTPEQLAAKAANCANARGQVERLSGPRANRLQYVDPDGKLAFYGEEQRAKLIGEAEAAVKKYCD